ncbi:enoyl-CoA hydratase EchA19-like isoform X1 [Clytia hemisphaerica]
MMFSRYHFVSKTFVKNSKYIKHANIFKQNISSQESKPCVIVERLDSLNVMTIGINRPQKRNCVNIEAAGLLISAFKEFEKDDQIHCAVLHGFGGFFCGGYDLEELSETPEKDRQKKISTIIFGDGPMGPTRMALTKPLIAAVSGYAVAGGLELASMCDMRVVEENAQFGVLCRRFGVPLIDGGTVRLPKLIGLSRAMDMILTGRLVGAEEALAFGLANRVVKKGTALNEAISLAKEISKSPQGCLRADRQSALYSSYEANDIDDAFCFEVENAAHVISEESIEGAKKFVSGQGKHGQFNVGDFN